MSKRKEKILGELGFTYAGLSGKTQKDFGRGKPFIPFMNIMSNGKIDPKFMGLVDVAPNERQNVVQKGDLFFTTSSETPEEVGMTSVLLEDVGECYLNSFCFGFRLYNFDDLLPEFAPYLFRGNEVRKQIINLGQGYTRFNLPKTELLKKLRLSIPSENEQKKISQILTKVDSIIEKTQAAIAKYKAIKQGMLQDLFTRGIDLNTNKLRPRYEDAPELYKESKLGMIPREWEVKRLENTEIEILDGDRGVNYPKENDLTESGHCLFLSATNVTKNGFKFTSMLFITKERDELLGTGKLVRKDIIVTTRGTIGNVVYYDKDVPYEHIRINSGMIILRNNDKEISNEYLYYFIKDVLFEIYFKDSVSGTAQPQLPIKDLKKLFVIYPKPDEQKLIAERIKAINNKLQTEQTYLLKMQNLKKGLMEDLLCGKKQVKVSEELVTQNVN